MIFKAKHLPSKAKAKHWSIRSKLITYGNNVSDELCHDFHHFSERELTFTFAICRHLSVCLSSVCLSVCNVRAPYSAD